MPAPRRGGCVRRRPRWGARSAATRSAGAGGEGPASGRRVPGVDGHRQEPRGRRSRPLRHAGAAPAAAPRGRRWLRGQHRGHAVVLLRGAGGGRGRLRRGRCSVVRVEDVVQVVRQQIGLVFFYRVKLGWAEVLPEKYLAIPGPPPLHTGLLAMRPPPWDSYRLSA
jgi:hypothetical protein